MPEHAPAPRYALYYVPAPESALWRFGCGLLGYDSIHSRDVPLAAPGGWSAADWHAATEEPRRYGFHATLKAPFRLADGRTEDDLRDALETFARDRAPAPLGALHVKTLGQFIAIAPEEQGDLLTILAADAVTAFEPFRAPLSTEDLARRRPWSLPPRERDYLDCYGYPYVLDAFRFHMTLSGPLPAAAIVPARAAIEAGFGRVDPLPKELDRIALCRQDDPLSRFRVLTTVLFA